MRLNVGQPAPRFIVVDVWDNRVDLADYVGKSVLLSFFRFSHCPYCNVRISQMIARAPAYRAAGLEIIAVFESPRASMLAGVGRQRPPFPLVADPLNALYESYGVETSKRRLVESFMVPTRAAKTIAGGFNALAHGFFPKKIDGPLTRMPADFLIGPGLQLAAVRYGRFPSDHLALSTLEVYLGIGNVAVRGRGAVPTD